MKGVIEAVSALLITGIMIGVVGTVYFWGLPLIQKNKDASVLAGTEDFMRELNNRVKLVANVGGREEVKFNLPGIISFDSSSIKVVLDTEGTIYAAEAPVPLSKNNPSAAAGTWGIDESEVISVIAQQLTDKKYRETYSLRYIPLTVKSDTGGIKIYVIEPTGINSVGGQGSSVIISSAGTKENTVNNETIISNMIEIVIS